MRIFMGLLALTAGLTAVSPARAQQAASEEQMRQAMELLRRKMAEPASTNATPSSPPASRTPAPAPAPAVRPAPAPAPQLPSQPATASPDSQPAAAPAATPAKPEAKPAPSAARPAAATPQGLSADQEKQARELLDSVRIERPTQPEVTLPPGQPSLTDAEREDAIRAAMEKAQALEQQRKQAQKEQAAGANDAALQVELQRVEAELLKGTGRKPAELPPAVPAFAPRTNAPVAVPSRPLRETSTPATAGLPKTEMTREQEDLARMLLELEAGKTSKPYDAATPTAAPERSEEAARTATTTATPTAPPVSPSAPNPPSAPPAPARTVNAPPPAPKHAPAPAPAGRAANQPAVVETKPAAAPVKASESSTTAGAKSKEARLAELLEAYKKNELTPAAYHRERAKILAE